MAQKPQHEEEQRLAFRVAVLAGLGLDVHVTLAGRKLAARVGDISAEGMFVTLEGGPLAALKVGTMVDIEVSFAGETIALYGVVRSQHEGGYGLFFPAHDPAGRANPVSRFGRISAQLQRASLSQRLKVLKPPD